MKYNIKDADGNITNTIVSDAEFVAANFDHYELYVEPTPPEPTAEEEGRQWRDSELGATDYIVPLTDHPQRAAHMTYREALRDWPSTDSFPATRPEL
jgi:UDP-N-acetyl-D-mannosaminuronate dehydrogenase